jgi:hypothetical protein
MKLEVYTMLVSNNTRKHKPSFQEGVAGWYAQKDKGNVSFTNTAGK